MVTRAPKRALFWISVHSPLNDLAGNTQTNQLLYSSVTYGGIATKGATVTRTILDLTFRPESLAQLNSMFYGITVVNADARAVGAFPDPQDLGDRVGWLVRGHEDVISSNLSDNSQLAKVRLDIRSQRILRNIEDELHLIMHNDTGSICQWGSFIRTLWKMPV